MWLFPCRSVVSFPSSPVVWASLPPLSLCVFFSLSLSLSTSVFLMLIGSLVGGSSDQVYVHRQLAAEENTRWQGEGGENKEEKGRRRTRTRRSVESKGGEREKPVIFVVLVRRIPYFISDFQRFLCLLPLLLPPALFFLRFFSFFCPRSSSM